MTNKLIANLLGSILIVTVLGSMADANELFFTIMGVLIITANIIAIARLYKLKD